jgi:hypothetical protein
VCVCVCVARERERGAGIFLIICTRQGAVFLSSLTRGNGLAYITHPLPIVHFPSFITSKYNLWVYQLRSISLHACAGNLIETFGTHTSDLDLARTRVHCRCPRCSSRHAQVRVRMHMHKYECSASTAAAKSVFV